MARFFDDLLGEHFGRELRVGPSPRPGYGLSVFVGARPNPARIPVLHLNLEEQRGLFDEEMSWVIYEDGAQREGHAWDDNMPDAPRQTVAFEPWVRRSLGEIIATVARDAIAAASVGTQGKRKKPASWWREQRAALATLDEQLRAVPVDLGPGVAWPIVAGLLVCGARLQDSDGRIELLARLRGVGATEIEQPWLTLAASSTINDAEHAWREILGPPFGALASSGERERVEALSGWLLTLRSEALLDQWVAELEHGCESALVLSRVAAQLQVSEWAPHAIRLLERAIALVGETPTLMGLLHGALVGSGEAERAAVLEGKLAAFAPVDDLQGQIDEYLRTYNAVAAHQQRTRVIPVSFRPQIERCLVLEEQLNRYWLSRPERERAQAVEDHRFVAGASALWISMFRDARDYGPAVERLIAVTKDWPLFRLQHAANRASVEVLLSNGMSACLDSPAAGHLEIALELLDRVEAEWPKPDLPDLYYCAACLRARQGDKRRALEQVSRARDAGADVRAMAADNDLASLHGDARFKKLVGVAR